MKKLILVVLAMMSLVSCGKQVNDSDELKPFDVKQDFNDNAFTFFGKAPVIMSGDKTEANAMTIGWGAIGNYIGYDRSIVTIFVAPGRYTYQFLEKYPRFTLMEFDDPKISEFMGTKSGRDMDKTAALGLHVAYTEQGTPYYKEAKTVIECEIMTAFHQTEADFRNQTPEKFYENFAAGVHTVYFGEIIGAWKR